MCLTPRNHFEFVDKLQRVESYTTYSASTDVCDYLDIDEKISVCDSELAILQLNIRGLYNKVGKLKELLTDSFNGKNPDIILLCETWQSKNSPIPIIEGYQVVQKHREHRKGGGVAILISEKLNYRRRPDLESNTNILEYCTIEVKLARENVICCSCYHAPNTDVKIFQTEYERLLGKLKTCKSKIVMGMDHNLDLLKYSKHRPTHDFIQINENFDLVPCITRPTRLTHSSATLIDNIFVNTEQVRDLRSVILINDISDHLPTCTILENVKLGLKKKRKIYSRKITENNLSMIRNELSAINW